MSIRHLRFACLFAASFCSALVSTMASASARRIPVQDFIRHVSYSGVKMSPNGDYLAMRAERNGRNVLEDASGRYGTRAELHQLGAGTSNVDSIGASDPKY